MTRTDVSSTLAAYAAGITFEALPEEVVHAAKRAILDSTGCAIAGIRTEPGRLLAGFFEELGGRPDSLVLSTGSRLPLPHAAHVNAALANLVDIDDTLGEGHLGATVVPPVLAATPQAPGSGRDLIAAVVAGYEVSARIGTAIRGTAERFRKVRGLGTFQVFGTAAALGRLLGLSADAMRSAFGIAGANAPVPSVYKEGIDERPMAWTKNNFGWSAQGGATAVLLAARGFRGHHAFLDGDRGFWRMAGSDRCDFEGMTSGLGEEFRILANTFKPYGCCRYHHPVLDAVRAIVRAHAPAPEAIRRIHVASIWRLSEHIDRAPATLFDAQYSLPVQIAAHVLGRAGRFDWTLRGAFDDPALLALARAVTYAEDPEHERAFEEEHRLGATVTITTADGSYTETVRDPWGSPQAPIGDADLERKFFDLTEPVIGEAAASRIVELCRTMDRVASLSSIPPAWPPAR